MPRPGGNMRTGAAFAAVTLLGQALFSADASAQSSERRLIDEIVRTAQTREPKNGFCARTGWPPGDSKDAFVAFLKAARKWVPGK
jgi:hypothetical protein